MSDLGSFDLSALADPQALRMASLNESPGPDMTPLSKDQLTGLPQIFGPSDKDAADANQSLVDYSTQLGAQANTGLDDTWNTKDRAKAVADAGAKAQDKMDTSMGKDTPISMPTLSPISYGQAPQLSMQTRPAGLTQPLKTYARGGLIRTMPPGGRAPSVPTAHSIAGGGIHHIGALAIPHPGRGMYADGGSMVPASEAGGIGPGQADRPAIGQRAAPPVGALPVMRPPQAPQMQRPGAHVMLNGSYADGGALHADSLLSHVMALRDAVGGAQPQNQGALHTGMQRGPGDGRSDSIHVQTPAGGKIAVGDGEFVMPSDVVSAAGRGSSEAGGRVMHHLAHHIRETYRKELGALPPPGK